jgi:biopolymer transport protein ExbD
VSIRFICPHCGKQLTAPESRAGENRKCPNCRTRVAIPATSDPRAASSPAADHPLLLIPKRATDYGDLIDMTAMVDIVFFLLIFFLVTSIQSLEAVIDLPAPQSEGASSNLQTAPDIIEDPTMVVVTIEADDSVWVEDEEALSEQDLRAKLRKARQENERDAMYIKGVGDATNGKFVMVLDAAADAGMKELLFSVENVDDEEDGG